MSDTAPHNREEPGCGIGGGTPPPIAQTAVEEPEWGDYILQWEIDQVKEIAAQDGPEAAAKFSAERKAAADSWLLQHTTARPKVGGVDYAALSANQAAKSWDAAEIHYRRLAGRPASGERSDDKVVQAD